MNCKKHNHIETSACAYTCPWCEIERLRERVKTLEEMGTSESARLSGLLIKERRRIEELEKAEKHWAFKHGVCKGMHHITTDQIRAAWKDKCLVPIGIHEMEDGTTETEIRLYIPADAVGIVRCECADHGLTHGESGPCVLCDGEGWVMKDETHRPQNYQVLPSPVEVGALEEEDE